MLDSRLGLALARFATGKLSGAWFLFGSQLRKGKERCPNFFWYDVRRALVRRFERFEASENVRPQK